VPTIIDDRFTDEARLERLEKGLESACDARARAIQMRERLDYEIEMLNRYVDDYERLIRKLKAKTSEQLNPLGN
jgi:hypothetical protein